MLFLAPCGLPNGPFGRYASSTIPKNRRRAVLATVDSTCTFLQPEHFCHSPAGSSFFLHVGSLSTQFHMSSCIHRSCASQRWSGHLQLHWMSAQDAYRHRLHIIVISATERCHARNSPHSRNFPNTLINTNGYCAAICRYWRASTESPSRVKAARAAEWINHLQIRPPFHLFNLRVRHGCMPRGRKVNTGAWTRYAICLEPPLCKIQCVSGSADADQSGPI